MPTRRSVIAPMCRLLLSMGIALALFGAPPAAQIMDRSIVSDHVRLSIPSERAWLGRDVITDLERCWRFMNPATQESLPRRVFVAIDWDGTSSEMNPRDGAITIGLNQPVAGEDVRAFILREASREMARMGLLNLARQSAPAPETAFLYQGMSELLAHEFSHSTRGLNCAWIIARLLDRMKLLGVSAQASWDSFSRGSNDLRAAAPGITFLATCRDLHGRDKLLKLFEAMRRGSLEEGVWSTLHISTAALEGAWLKRVREQPQWGDLTVTSDEDAPVLEKSELPGMLHSGSIIRFRVFLRDRNDDLLPDGVFAIDEGSGAVTQAIPGPPGAAYLAMDLKIENDRRPGSYACTLVAIDEAGNVRNWQSKYTVE